MLPLVIYDDLADDASSLCDLSPLADLRPSFEVRTGALTTLDRILLSRGTQRWSGIVGRARIGAPRGAPLDPSAGDVLHISGRCVLLPAELDALPPGQALVEALSGRWIAFRGACTAADTLSRGELPGWARAAAIPGRFLLTRPWHVRTLRDAAIAQDLAHLTARVAALEPRPGVILVGQGPIHAGPGVTVSPGAILDASGGPIVLDDGSTVRPGAIVVGPAYIGPNSTILEHALIKPNTAIGPWCKVAGEVGGTIIQGYSNKAHDGHLGDSWLGEWVNLGAGTVNSNLLNTYGEVIARARPDGPNERTGERFLGTIIGDHAKTAIGTRIMTGCIIHTGAMIATSVPTSGCIPPFAWWTDEGRRTYRPAKFLEVARAMMARRSVEPSSAYTARLEVLLSQA